MPNLPLVTGNLANAVASSDVGTGRVAAALLADSGVGAFAQAFGQAIDTRQRLRLAEEEQAVGARALTLQNQLKTAELETASTTGNADDYLARMQEVSDSLFLNAYEGLNANQARALAPKIEALQSAHDYNIKSREMFKRLDAGRGSLAAQEREALAVMRNPDSSPYDRGIAQANYFESLAGAVNSGLYDSVTAESIKTKFNDTALGLNTAAAEDAFVAQYASQIEGSGITDPREISKYIDSLPGTVVERQKLRDEVDDRISRARKRDRENEADVAGAIGAAVMADPGSYTLQQIKDMPGLAGRFKDDVAKLYKTARDEGGPVDDNPVVRATVLEKIRTMPPQELASYNFLPEFYGPDNKLGLTSKTMNFVWSAQQQARSGASSAIQKRLNKAYARGNAQASDRGLKGDKALAFTSAFAFNYPQDRDLTPTEEIQLGDSVSAETDIEVPWTPMDIEGQPFNMTREDMSSAIEDGDITDWPDFWKETALRNIATSDTTPGLSWEEKRQKALNFSLDNPEKFRDRARTALAPYMETLK